MKITESTWFGWPGCARYFYIIKANQNSFVPGTKSPETITVLALLFAPGLQPSNFFFGNQIINH